MGERVSGTESMPCNGREQQVPLSDHDKNFRLTLLLTATSSGRNHRGCAVWGELGCLGLSRHLNEEASLEEHPFLCGPRLLAVQSKPVYGSDNEKDIEISFSLA